MDMATVMRMVVMEVAVGHFRPFLQAAVNLLYGFGLDREVG